MALTIVVLAMPATVVAVTSPFGDVDPADTFFGNIVNMANSGITSGCGGGNYCPDSPVTRAQMAAFLNRAAPRESIATFDEPTGAVTPTNGQTIATVTAKSLNNEYLSISAALYATISGAGTYPCENFYAFYVDGVAKEPIAMLHSAGAQPSNYATTQIAGHLLVPVAAGTHTVTLRYLDDVGSCTNYPGRGALWVQVVPFDASMNSISTP